MSRPIHAMPSSSWMSSSLRASALLLAEGAYTSNSTTSVWGQLGFEWEF